MFDFSVAGILVAFASSLFWGFSPLAVLGMLAALAAAVLAGGAGRRSARAVWFVIALALAVSVFVRQGSEVDGERRALARIHALAVKAEAERADRAEAITADLAASATRDLAEAQADATNLKDLSHALSTDPRRNGLCLDRGMARRLRAL